MGFDKLFDALTGEGIRCMQDEPMSRHTTFRIGGPARLMAFPDSETALLFTIAACCAAGLPYRVVGNGSNLLVADEGVNTLVIITMGIKSPPPDVAGGFLSATAGESLTVLCGRACIAGLAGLEFAYGIPGTVGGAVYMNAGAYGGEMKDVIYSVTVYDPESGAITDLPVSELAFGYRRSLFMDRPLIILSAVFRLQAGDRAEIKARMEDYLSRRRDKQPLDWPSAGSTFKRPEGAYAAALIDQCGLKGFQMGGARVSDKHAGFVINAGGATCADATALMEEVGRVVLEKTGFVLEPEIRVFR